MSKNNIYQTVVEPSDVIKSHATHGMPDFMTLDETTWRANEPKGADGKVDKNKVTYYMTWYMKHASKDGKEVLVKPAMKAEGVEIGAKPKVQDGKNDVSVAIKVEKDSEFNKAWQLIEEARTILMTRFFEDPKNKLLPKSYKTRTVVKSYKDDFMAKDDQGNETGELQDLSWLLIYVNIKCDKATGEPAWGFEIRDVDQVQILPKGGKRFAMATYKEFPDQPDKPTAGQPLTNKNIPEYLTYSSRINSPINFSQLCFSSKGGSMLKDFYKIMFVKRAPKSKYSAEHEFDEDSLNSLANMTVGNADNEPAGMSHSDDADADNTSSGPVADDDDVDAQAEELLRRK